MQPAPTRGVHHVGLTVHDCHAAAAFFVDALGFSIVGGRPAYPSVFVSDGHVMLTLWQAPGEARAFDRKAAIGLHHLALRVASDVDLDRLVEQLAARDDVAVEFVPEALGTGGLRHAMLRVPSGLRLELTWSPA